MRAVANDMTLRYRVVVTHQVPKIVLFGGLAQWHALPAIFGRNVLNRNEITHGSKDLVLSTENENFLQG